jgi:hypothetical protein
VDPPELLLEPPELLPELLALDPDPPLELPEPPLDPPELLGLVWPPLLLDPEEPLFPEELPDPDALPPFPLAGVLSMLVLPPSSEGAGKSVVPPYGPPNGSPAPLQPADAPIASATVKTRRYSKPRRMILLRGCPAMQSLTSRLGTAPQTRVNLVVWCEHCPHLKLIFVQYAENIESAPSARPAGWGPRPSPDERRNVIAPSSSPQPIDRAERTR